MLKIIEELEGKVAGSYSVINGMYVDVYMVNSYIDTDVLKMVINESDFIGVRIENNEMVIVFKCGG